MDAGVAVRSGALVVRVQDVGAEWEVRHVSDSVGALLGLPAAEVVGRQGVWEARIHDQDRGRALRAAQSALEGETSSVEYRIQHADGTWRWVLDHMSPPDEPLAHPTTLTCVSLDITERRTREDALRRQVEALQRSNRDLEQFAHIASHDLSEPLRMVSSYTQIIADRYGERLDEAGLELLAFAVEGAHRMQAMVKGLLDYSRLGQGERVLQAVDTLAVAQAARAALRLSLEEAGAELEIGELPTVPGTESQLFTLFQNLVANAVKFRREGVAPRIRTCATREDEHWRFEVEDNGIGIPPEAYERVFQIFQRLHGREQYAGTGLGLALCRRIVERHGGRIGIAPAEEHGTRFWFTLPADAPAEPAGESV